MKVDFLTNGVLSTGVAGFTNGFSDIFVLGEELIFVPPFLTTEIKPVTIRRELRWIPREEQIKLIFSVWGQAKDTKQFWFEIWNRKYDYVDVLLEILEKKFGSVPLLFNIYDIRILEDKASEIEIIGLSENGSILEGKDFGWSIVDDK